MGVFRRSRGLSRRELLRGLRLRLDRPVAELDLDDELGAARLLEEPVVDHPEWGSPAIRLIPEELCREECGRFGLLLRFAHRHRWRSIVAIDSCGFSRRCVIDIPFALI